MLIYKMVSGGKQQIYSILVSQIDITSDLERFLIKSSKRPAFNGMVRYFASGLLDC